jgi:hypothetical protein
MAYLFVAFSNAAAGAVGNPNVSTTPATAVTNLSFLVTTPSTRSAFSARVSRSAKEASTLVSDGTKAPRKWAKAHHPVPVSGLGGRGQSAGSQDYRLLQWTCDLVYLASSFFSNSTLLLYNLLG